jgi:hypothetical protein
LLRLEYLLRYSALRLLLHHLGGADAVDKHPRQHGSGGVDHTHTGGLGDLLLVATVVLGDLLGRLEVKRLGLHGSPTPAPSDTC